MTILGKDNQTLQGHIQDCLTACDEIIRLREPFLREFCQRYGWDWEDVRRALRFATWFHDIGKASDEWQRYIRGNGTRITHALPSFGIGLMASNAPRPYDSSPIYAALFAILAHHGQLHKNAFSPDNYRWQAVTLPVDYINTHFQAFCGLEPGFRLTPWRLDKVRLSDICKAIETLKQAVKKTDLAFKALYSLLLNVLTAADGYASGNVPEGGGLENPLSSHLASEALSSIENFFPFYNNGSLERLPFVPEPNIMQRDMVQQDSQRIILNAGCGEGKTAAALLYAQELLKQNLIDRIIFTLPTKFTANNLSKDLTDKKKYAIPQELVGITHGDAAEFLRQQQRTDTEDRTMSEDESENMIMAQVFENSTYAKPITISTVDHLIMSLYHGYKFSDRAFSNVASALVVFDEVHYYEQQTLRAIAETVRRLTQLKIPHLVMTATIPQAVHERLDQLVPNRPYTFQRAPAVIEGTSTPKMPFKIERFSAPFIDEEDRSVSSELLEQVEQNIGRRQIVFANQVARSKNIYQALIDAGISENVICYHSGFISKHRNEKERMIRALFKPSEKLKKAEIELLDQHGFENNGSCILASTQVSELSLDISADVMHSEIAPIDSIIQRGGRLNRKGETPEQNGYVSTLYVAPPYESEKACLPYDIDILQRSWEVLDQDYTFQNGCAWVNVVHSECSELMHNELSKAIDNDLIFGKKPQDNYGEDAEEGHVVIRRQNYQTYDVVPFEFAETVEDDYRNYRSHHLSISEIVFRIAVSNDKILSREGKLKLRSWKGKTREVPIPFKVIQSRYTFETGLVLDEDAVSNVL